MKSINENMTKETEELIERFGAERISKLKEIPNFYTFTKGLIYSHRDFDKFYAALKEGKKCAIVSGFNPSGTIHIGHKILLDTNLFFQREFNVPIFIPLSDDESYVAGKVNTQEEGLNNAMRLVKELLAYGFDPLNTYFIIDQIYTNIYNLAIKLSKGTTLSTIKATYGYSMDKNPGLFFYPAIQSAHILLPLESLGYEYVLVPIGPDEDCHIRICRDLAPKFSLNKPSIIHSIFLPGLTGTKMSTTNPNSAIFLKDSEENVRKKAMNSFSGGKSSIEEHRRLGGNPDNDIACIYLDLLFLSNDKSKEIIENYKNGTLLSGDLKRLFADYLVDYVMKFQHRLKQITSNDIQNCILRNECFGGK